MELLYVQLLINGLFSSVNGTRRVRKTNMSKIKHVDLFIIGENVSHVEEFHIEVKGMPTSSKTDEFSEKGGGGPFSIQKFMLQIFAIIDDTSDLNFGKNLQHNFPKMRGESKAVWNFFENSSVLEEVDIP